MTDEVITYVIGAIATAALGLMISILQRLTRVETKVDIILQSNNFEVSNENGSQ